MRRRAGTEILRYERESVLLQAFGRFVREVDPDVISGYNIIPFDIPFLFDRADELGSQTRDALTNIGRLERNAEHSGNGWGPPWKHLLPVTKLRAQRLSSAAFGDNEWQRLDMAGRWTTDQLVVVRNGHNLSSYKLDAVASHFMHGGVDDVSADGCEVRVATNDVRGLALGDYVTLSYVRGAVRETQCFPTSTGVSSAFSTSASKSSVAKKLAVVQVTTGASGTGGTYALRAPSPSVALEWVTAIGQCDRWNHAKDDVPPEEIFRLQRGTSADRARLARYCIKDVQLTVELLAKILVIESSVAMANINGVPLPWVQDRGQGARTQAFIARVCRRMGYVMPRLYHSNPRDNADHDFDDTSATAAAFADIKTRRYGELPSEKVEGAYVLVPEPGIYDETPVAVTDYTSLYPSAMIAKNMSHETLVYRPEHLGDAGRARLEADGYTVYDVEYDGNVYTDVDPEENDRPIDPKPVGRQTARFVCKRDAKTGEPVRGVLPTVLQELLMERKQKKREMKAAAKKGQHFLASVLDGVQLALKVTANSIYGQTGSRTSKFRCTTIASATTAEGRSMLLNAKAYVERRYTADTPLDLPALKQRVVGARVVYGDTDSIFIVFDVRDAVTGDKVIGAAALAAVAAGEDVEHSAAAEAWMLHPHVLEYEKVYYPFLLLRKKGYVGIKYGAGKDVRKRKSGSLSSMGIVLKRRDNPPVLKRIYGDMIDGIMEGRPFRDIVAGVRRQVAVAGPGPEPREPSARRPDDHQAPARGIQESPSDRPQGTRGPNRGT